MGGRGRGGHGTRGGGSASGARRFVEIVESRRLGKIATEKATKEVRAKLRGIFWRAWAQYRPIFGGAVLGYSSLREQYVYKRAAKLYAAAFESDPGKSGRALAAWLRHATPMETETASVAGSDGSQPSKRAKKSRGSRAQPSGV